MTLGFVLQALNFNLWFFFLQLLENSLTQGFVIHPKLLTSDLICDITNNLSTKPDKHLLHTSLNWKLASLVLRHGR